MTSSMITVLALCGTHFILPWPKNPSLKSGLKDLGVRLCVYTLLWIAQSILYIEVVLRWLVF